MSEKKLSKEQLDFLKQIVNSQEGNSSNEAAGGQDVINTDSYEAFGRAIIEQIKNASMEEVEKSGGSKGEIVLDTQITISPANSEDQEFLGSIIDIIKDHLPDPRDYIPKEYCIKVWGRKICVPLK